MARRIAGVYYVSLLTRFLRISTFQVTVIVLVLAVSILSLPFLGVSVSGASNAVASAPNRSKSPDRHSLRALVS